MNSKKTSETQIYWNLMNNYDLNIIIELDFSINKNNCDKKGEGMTDLSSSRYLNAISNVLEHLDQGQANSKTLESDLALIRFLFVKENTADDVSNDLAIIALEAMKHFICQGFSNLDSCFICNGAEIIEQDIECPICEGRGVYSDQDITVNECICDSGIIRRGNCPLCNNQDHLQEENQVLEFCN